MRHKRILVLSTYPVEEPLHGGQKRVQATLDFYKSIFGEVRFVAVSHGRFYDKYGPHDLIIKDQKIIKEMERVPYLSDLISGEAIYEDKYVRSKLGKMMNEFKPDVIETVQIFPYVGLKKILSELRIRPKIILNSQNDETRLKRDILEGVKIPSAEKQVYLNRVERLEEKCSKEADLVIAVNQSDADRHIELGAKKCVVIPNGISKVVPTQAALDHWLKFKKEKEVDNLITFVGSAHPPNLIGFETMVGYDLNFLPEKTCLMLAGGVSNHIQQELVMKKNNQAKQFWQRAWPLGNLSDDNLAGLIRISDVIILPITSGVGSNLKTAEAILADKKVVATHLAFKTFESFSTLPNIYFAKNQDSFKESIVTALRTQKVKRNNKQQALARKVQWKYCLTPLRRHIELLMYSRGAIVARSLKRNTLRVVGRAKRLVKT